MTCCGETEVIWGTMQIASVVQLKSWYTRWSMFKKYLFGTILKEVVGLFSLTIFVGQGLHQDFKEKFLPEAEIWFTFKQPAVNWSKISVVVFQYIQFCIEFGLMNLKACWILRLLIWMHSSLYFIFKVMLNWMLVIGFELISCNINLKCILEVPME